MSIIVLKKCYVLTAPSKGIGSIDSFVLLATVNINLPKSSGSNVEATTV